MHGAKSLCYKELASGLGGAGKGKSKLGSSSQCQNLNRRSGSEGEGLGLAHRKEVQDAFLSTVKQQQLCFPLLFAGWGYIVACAKVLRMCQTYHA
jgi:hypothetical protein